jgi:hypothetical protein
MSLIEGEGLRTTCKSCGAKVSPPDDYCKRCEDAKLTGIGGWLYLPAIYLVLGICTLSVAIVKTTNIPPDAEETFLRNIVLAEVLGYDILLIMVIYASFLFFKKKRQLPKFFIAFLFALVAFDVADIWGAVQFLNQHVEGSDVWTLVMDALLLGIWVPYFRISKRVKLTFVN